MLLGKTNEKKKTQRKSLQAMKEVVENCAEAYRGHDVRLVLQVLLNRHTQVQRGCFCYFSIRARTWQGEEHGKKE